jgi:hypothetical protein
MDHLSSRFKGRQHRHRDGGFLEKLERAEDEVRYRLAHPKFIQTDEELMREQQAKKSRPTR